MQPLNCRRRRQRSLQIRSFTDDPNTFTTHGLANIVTHLFEPVTPPYTILAGLPAPLEMDKLNDAATPTGAFFASLSQRQLTSPGTMTLSSKDRSYLAFFIETQCRKLQDLQKEKTDLEELVDEKELEKAGMQADITHYYALWVSSRAHATNLERFVDHLVHLLPVERSTGLAGLAAVLGVDLVAVTNPRP